jgi:hypothetical protein
MARLGERHGAAWTPEEDLQLEEGHTAGMNLTELAARHQRGRGAIRKSPHTARTPSAIRNSRSCRRNIGGIIRPTGTGRHQHGHRH